MEITETDYEEINRALIDLDSFYKKTSEFSDDIIEKARYICYDACDRPEFFENGFNMDAGLKAVEIYVREKYPWLTEHAVWMVRHYCMMNMK
ncbi:MAG: hypothetical protein IPP66_05425 [Anaerolineales bacterium]|nr:hypothetical protein [Anaerolineales bacterium]